MINCTVDIAFRSTSEENPARLMRRERAHVEMITSDGWLIRLEDDTEVNIDHHEIKSVVLTDEEDHHQFVNAFLSARRQNMIRDVASQVLIMYDKISNVIPDDIESFATDLKAHLIVEFDARV